MRRLVPLAFLLAFAACRDYDRYQYVAGQKGLIAPDEYATYGPDQAISMAIGREFAKGHLRAMTPPVGAKQTDAALTYARRTVPAGDQDHRRHAWAFAWS